MRRAPRRAIPSDPEGFPLMQGEQGKRACPGPRQKIRVMVLGSLTGEYAMLAWVRARTGGREPAYAGVAGFGGLAERPQPSRVAERDRPGDIIQAAAQGGRPAQQDERERGGPTELSSECVMSYGSYHEIVPRLADKWIPLNTSEININDERELVYWTNELRISIGDLIWLVEKYGTSADRIRSLVK